MNFWHKVFIFVVLALALAIGGASANAIILLPTPNATLALNAKKCMKVCATNLKSCFAQNPTLLGAPTDPLDQCRSKANACVTACNVPLYTIGCEDRCATALEGCLLQATTATDKAKCHVSNKACLLKACQITAANLSSDYCPKQCTRAKDICAAGGNIPGVDCTAGATDCSKACPASISFTGVSAGTGATGGLFTANRLQLQTNFSTLLTQLRGLQFNFKVYSTNLNQLSANTCPEEVVVCEKTYKQCAAGSVDQGMDQMLLQAKNECIQTCAQNPPACFGVTKATCKPALTKLCACSDKTTGSQTCNEKGTAWGACVCAPAKVCNAGERRLCSCGGLSGIQVCNKDGSGYGACLCLAATCAGTAPTCPQGYSGSYQCSNGTWVNNCVAPPAPPTCQGAAPPCPSGYTGSYQCVDGIWVNQCTQAMECVPAQTRTVACYMPTGQLGSQVDTCNGNGLWTPGTCVASNVTCTSWTYSAWSACQSNSQTRTVLAQQPAGCVGGNPILTQTCVSCQGSQPTCPENYANSYACVNGQWTGACTPKCTGVQPSCQTGWEGQYSCMSTFQNGQIAYVWMNTCLPPGPDMCYRGVRYRMVGQNAYAKCDGMGKYDEAGRFCLLNDCGLYQPWNNYGTEAGFKAYTDTMYQTHVDPPNSCNPSFKYTQC